jgi:hypothetical protein
MEKGETDFMIGFSNIKLQPFFAELRKKYAIIQKP